jgi:hypothetical protein
VWLRNRWRIAAHGAIAPARYPKLREAQRERIVGQQTSGERLTGARDQLDGLGRLERTEHTGQHSEHPGLGTVGHHAIHGLRENAAIAGAAARHVGHEVTFETMDGRRHQRPAQNHAGVIYEVTRGEAVGAIEHQVVLREELAHVPCAQLERMGDDAHFGIERGEALAPALRLQLTEARAVEQHLALQIREIDAVVIEKSERAAAGRSQVQRRRRAEAARAHDQHARALEPLLTRGTDFAERQVSPVALALAARQAHPSLRKCTHRVHGITIGREAGGAPPPPAPPALRREPADR